VNKDVYIMSASATQGGHKQVRYTAQVCCWTDMHLLQIILVTLKLSALQLGETQDRFKRGSVGSIRISSSSCCGKRGYLKENSIVFGS